MIYSYYDLAQIPSIENLSCDELVGILESCYRKYKSSVYYRCGSIFSEATIAAFESCPDVMQETFRSMAKALLRKDQNYFDRLIEKIGYKAVVKLTEKALPNGDCQFITNKTNKSDFRVKKINFFADFPIELYILDTFWTCLIGKALVFSDRLSLCRGYVLDSKIVERVGIDFQSLSLFQPYFDQYRQWETEPVKQIEHLYDEHEDSALITLDISRYFYSVNLDFDDLFTMFVRENESYSQFRWLHGLEGKIYKAYSARLGRVDFSIGEKVVLPLGLPSACVLSNFYLSDVDHSFPDLSGFVYYRRYVDDMILVLKGVEPGEKSFDDFVSGRLSGIFKKSGEGYSFRFDESLVVQKDKTKIFQTIADGPKTTIEKLKKQGFAASEPQLVPENEYSYDNFIKNVYPDNDSLKIRDIESVSLNYRAFSSMISNYLLFEKKGGTDPSENDQNATVQENKNKEREQLIKFFQTENLLDYCLKWKSIVLFASVYGEGDHPIFGSAVNSLANDISEIRLDDSLSNFNREVLSMRLKKDMASLLILAEASAAAINGYILEGLDLLKIQNLSYQLFNANLINHSALVFPLIPYLENTEAGKDYRDCNLRSLLGRTPKKLSNFRVKYSPRFIHFGEYFIFESLLEGADVNNPFFLSKVLGSYRDNTKGVFTGFEPPCIFEPNEGEKPIVRITLPKSGVHEKKEFSVKHIVGLANVKAEIGRIVGGGEAACGKTDKIEDATKRYVYKGFSADYLRTIRKLLRESRGVARDKKWILEDEDFETEKKQTESLDFLIFPELSIPIEWASVLEQFSRSSGIGIVAGLISEPSEKKFVNYLLTIVPYRDSSGHRCALPLIRLKNAYSPLEKEVSANSGLDTAVPCNKLMYLVRWGDYSFSTFLCYELTDVETRASIRGEVNTIFAVEFNKDTDYFASVVSATSRDLSCFVAQDNIAQFGGTMVVGPLGTKYKTIFSITHGEISTMNFSYLDLERLNQYLENFKKADESKEKKYENETKDDEYRKPSAGFVKKY